MKKIAVLTILMMFATCGYVFAAGAELAANALTSDDGMQIYGGVDATDAARTGAVLLGKMSKGVNFRSQFTATGFAAATYHLNGSKAYGTAHDSTAIFFQDVGSAAADSLWSLSAASNASFGAAWTEM